MAKAILEYDLSDFDDKQSHLRAIKSSDMAGALWDITHNTKKSLEWAMDGKEMDKYDALEMVFEKIYEILDEHGIKIDELF